MATFKEATQVRLQLKMKFSQHAWYSGSAVVTEQDGYSVIITVTHLDNKIRKLVSPVVNDIGVKVEVE